MKRNESNTDALALRDVAVHSSALLDAEQMALEAQSDRRLLARFTRKGRAYQKHEEGLTKVLYKGKEDALEMVMVGRVKALREQVNHALIQGGIRLRRETAELALMEYSTLEERVIEYLQDQCERARDLKEQAEKYADMPSLKRRMERQLEDLLNKSEAYVDTLVDDFRGILKEKV